MTGEPIGQAPKPVASGAAHQRSPWWHRVSSMNTMTIIRTRRR